MRKGQTALEYLVTYGWAILAIVIIAAVLWYFGVFNPSKWTGARQCGGFSAFTCIDYTNTATNATVVLGNAVGRQLNITSGASCNPSLIGANEQTTCVFSGTFTPGTQASLSLTYVDTKSGLTKTDNGFIKAT